MEDEDEVITLSKKQSEAPPKRKPKKIIIPRRAPSVVIPGREVVFITPDKTTCEKCTCFPKEDPYVKPKKLNPCQRSPLTLYELAASVVDSLKLPAAFAWTEEDVANWMAEVVGLPQYSQCILDNHINGLRLLMLEDLSHLPHINVHDFSHIQKITEKVREAYSVEFVRFARSIGLPPRKPLTHTTWFKSRTGPSWGIRKNWSRCDILRWMKIIMPKPVYLDHWDLVWYHKPDFPKVMFGRIKKKAQSQVCIPHYSQKVEVCKEYQVPRKFRFQTGIADDAQMIWMERPGSVQQMEKKKDKKFPKVKLTVPVETRLVPKRVSLTGLRGEELVLARRKMAKPKFFA